MNIFKVVKIKKSDADKKLDKAIKEFDEYLEKIKKGNPTINQHNFKYKHLRFFLE